ARERVAGQPPGCRHGWRWPKQTGSGLYPADDVRRYAEGDRSAGSGEPGERDLGLIGEAPPVVLVEQLAEGPPADLGVHPGTDRRKAGLAGDRAGWPGRWGRPDRRSRSASRSWWAMRRCTTSPA